MGAGVEGRPLLQNQNLLAQRVKEGTPVQVPKVPELRQGVLPTSRGLAVVDGLCFNAILLCDLVQVT